MKRPVALVIDRDPAAREQIRSALDRHGVDALSASAASEITQAFRDRRVRLVIADLTAHRVELQGLAVRTSPPPIVIALAHDAAGADASVEEGVFDVLLKPLDEKRLQWTLRAALRHLSVLEELRTLRGDLQRREGYDGVVGHSTQIERLRQELERLANDDTPVWFCGETGAGKEHAARELHARSARRSGRFEVLASTGAGGRSWSGRLGVAAGGDGAPEGLLAALGGGTLYLEDLPAQPPKEQAKLLPLLDAPHEVRVLAGSTVNPATLAGDGLLLDELRRKLAVETVVVPPLRERAEDIPLLAQHFIRTICRINELPSIQIEAEALALLERHRWPDNVQGLRNALEQAAIVSPDAKIRARDLPAELREPSRTTAEPATAAGSGAASFREAKRQVVDGFERRYLRGLMERYGGNVTAASEQAGMLRSALQRLLRKYGLKSADFRRQRQASKQPDGLRPRG